MSQQSDLKKKLNPITAEPDASLWPTILSTMKRRAVVRAVLVGTSICVLGVIVATSLIWRDLPSKHTSQTVAQQIDSTSVTDTAVGTTVAVDKAVPVSEPKVEQKTTVQAPRKEILTESEINELLWHEVSTQFAEPVAVKQKQQSSEVVKPSSHDKDIDSTPVKKADSTEPKVTANPVAEKDADLPQTEPAKSGSYSEPDETALSMPNIMLLNDPNIANRQFRVYANEPIKSFKVYIYNRGGRQVYQSDNINNAWDGTYKGSQVPQGTYAYIVFYTDKDGNSHREKGSITVVK